MYRGHLWVCFSPLISHIFLYLREAVSAVCWDPSTPGLYVYTPLRTHSSSFFKRQFLWKQGPPRESDGGKETSCPSSGCTGGERCWLQRSSAPRPFTAATAVCSPTRTPHLSASSFSHSLPLPSLSSLSQWGKVFSAPTVQALIRLSAARACGRSREQGSLEETPPFQLNEGFLSSVLSWAQSLLCRLVSSYQGKVVSLSSLSLSLSRSLLAPLSLSLSSLISLSLALFLSTSTFCWSLPLVQWPRGRLLRMVADSSSARSQERGKALFNS